MIFLAVPGLQYPFSLLCLASFPSLPRPTFEDHDDRAVDWETGKNGEKESCKWSNATVYGRKKDRETSDGRGLAGDGETLSKGN